VSHRPELIYPLSEDGFDVSGTGWYVLGGKTYADLPASSGGTEFDPWRIAGETPNAPTNANTTEGGDFDEIADPSFAHEPGHVWPFQGLSAVQKSTGGGYVPACRDKEGVNHYRRFCRLAPMMFGSTGRRVLFRLPLRILATNARDCLDVIIHHDLVTSVNPGTGANTTAFAAGKYGGFRWVLGNLGAAEVSGELLVWGHAMGAFKQTWGASLVVAAQANPESTAPAIDQRRGPIMLDLTATGPNMDTVGSQLAFLFAARGNTAIAYDAIGVAGGALQDGTEVYVKVGAAIALLSPGT
jgi:hypothetical protein